MLGLFVYFILDPVFSLYINFMGLWFTSQIKNPNTAAGKGKRILIYASSMYSINKDFNNRILSLEYLGIIV